MALVVSVGSSLEWTLYICVKMPVFIPSTFNRMVASLLDTREVHVNERLNTSRQQRAGNSMFSDRPALEGI